MVELVRRREQKSAFLPVLPNFLEVPLIGQTQPGVNGPGDIVDTVHRGQLHRVQNGGVVGGGEWFRDDSAQN